MVGITGQTALGYPMESNPPPLLAQADTLAIEQHWPGFQGYFIVLPIPTRLPTQ